MFSVIFTSEMPSGGHSSVSTSSKLLRRKGASSAGRRELEAGSITRCSRKRARDNPTYKLERSLSRGDCTNRITPSDSSPLYEDTDDSRTTSSDGDGEAD